MSPDELLALFAAAADAQGAALAAIPDDERRARTDRPGQYALDVVADAAVLDVLAPTGVAIVSEESGRTGNADAPVTVVVDPVDGSTNCARGIPYWAISLCALDADGPVCALVANGATGERTTAVRGDGAWRGGRRLVRADTRRIEDSLVVLEGFPARRLAWKQFRALGSVALALCDVAAGGADGYLDVVGQCAPWDYLGGLLVAHEAGAIVVDARGRELVTADITARRQPLAAATPRLLEALRDGLAA